LKSFKKNFRDTFLLSVDNRILKYICTWFDLFEFAATYNAKLCHKLFLRQKMLQNSFLQLLFNNVDYSIYSSLRHFIQPPTMSNSVICFLYVKKSSRTLSYNCFLILYLVPFIPVCVILYNNLLCQTLSYAFLMSKKVVECFSYD